MVVCNNTTQEAWRWCGMPQFVCIWIMASYYSHNSQPMKQYLPGFCKISTGQNEKASDFQYKVKGEEKKVIWWMFLALWNNVSQLFKLVCFRASAVIQVQGGDLSFLNCHTAPLWNNSLVLRSDWASSNALTSQWLPKRVSICSCTWECLPSILSHFRSFNNWLQQSHLLGLPSHPHPLQGSL